MANSNANGRGTTQGVFLSRAKIDRLVGGLPRGSRGVGRVLLERGDKAGFMALRAAVLPAPHQMSVGGTPA